MYTQCIENYLRNPRRIAIVFTVRLVVGCHLTLIYGSLLIQMLCCVEISLREAHETKVYSIGIAVSEIHGPRHRKTYCIQVVLHQRSNKRGVDISRSMNQKSEISEMRA